MTGPKGNSEFYFPETLNVPRGEAEGNIEVEGKQNSLSPEGPVIKCFVISPNSKIEKTAKISFVRAAVALSCPAETIPQ